MGARVAVLAVVAVAVGAEPQPSSGCSGGQPDKAGWRKVHVEDYVPVDRQYFVTVPPRVAAPDNGTAPQPAPLLLSFHGQFGNASQYAREHDFGRYGRADGLVVAYLQGMQDGSQGSGWNVGTAADDSTCVGEIVRDTACYDSCWALRQCGRCNWSTCFDDRKFVEATLAALGAEFCIDLRRIYVQGESNGGMLAHYLAQEMPGTFAAVIPFYGHPLVGYAVGAGAQLVRSASLVAQTALLNFHGRHDRLIPPVGGVSSQGWIYEPLEKVLLAWAGVHDCSLDATQFVTPWDGGTHRLACVEFPYCASGRRIVRCLYDGMHGAWPDKTSGEQLTVWFALRFARNSTGNVEFSSAYERIEGLLRGDREASIVTLSVGALVGALICTALGAGAVGALVARRCRATNRAHGGKRFFPMPGSSPVDGGASPNPEPIGAVA